MTARRARWVLPGVIAVVAITAYATGRLGGRLAPDEPPPIDVTVPVLSPVAQAGREAYDRGCARCHGQHGAGSPAGPPLVHPIYRAAHHADVAFALAVRQGVRAHHWRLGDMPPKPDVRSDELAAITRYIRELQRANGIE